MFACWQLSSVLNYKIAFSLVEMGDLYTESGHTLQGSFSAGSKPIFATKYSLESSRRDLQNALLCTALHFHFFQKIAKFFANFYRDFARFCQNIAIFLPKFCNILTKFRWNFAVICPEKMHQRPGVPGSSREFPGVPGSFPRFAAYGNSPQPAIPRIS